jgi:hypothetical protein
MPDAKGKWAMPADGNAKIGLFGFDSLTGTGDELMKDMADAAAAGKSIGGMAAVRFESGDATSGTLIVGNNNQAHYGQAQCTILKAIGLLNRLSGFKYATATARRGADADTTETILGPQFPGKALTSEVPRLFTYTFRLMKIAESEKEGEHRLYFVTHKDRTAAMAKSFGNSRIPLAARGVKGFELPTFITPASVVKALEIIYNAEKTAEDVINKRLE